MLFSQVFDINMSKNALKRTLLPHVAVAALSMWMAIFRRRYKKKNISVSLRHSSPEQRPHDFEVFQFRTKVRYWSCVSSSSFRLFCRDAFSHHVVILAHSSLTIRQKWSVQSQFSLATFGQCQKSCSESMKCNVVFQIWSLINTNVFSRWNRRSTHVCRPTLVSQRCLAGSCRESALNCSRTSDSWTTETWTTSPSQV